jgi:hypothetical protein
MGRFVLVRSQSRKLLRTEFFFFFFFLTNISNRKRQIGRRVVRDLSGVCRVRAIVQDAHSHFVDEFRREHVEVIPANLEHFNVRLRDAFNRAHSVVLIASHERRSRNQMGTLIDLVGKCRTVQHVILVSRYGPIFESPTIHKDFQSMEDQLEEFSVGQHVVRAPYLYQDIVDRDLDLEECAVRLPIDDKTQLLLADADDVALAIFNLLRADEADIPDKRIYDIESMEVKY